MSKFVIILGLGGHARVVADTCVANEWEIKGFVGPQPDTRTLEFFVAPYLGTDEVLDRSKFSAELVNGLGTLSPGSRRAVLYRDLCVKGYHFATLCHPSCVVGGAVNIGSGVQILAGAVVQPGSVIGENTILNTRCSIDHDCVIGAHCHIAPGAVLSGGVELGEDVHIGTGAVVLQGIKIGAGAMIAAGAVVTRDVEAGTRVAGVPARIF